MHMFRYDTTCKPSSLACNARLTVERLSVGFKMFDLGIRFLIPQLVNKQKNFKNETKH